MKKSELKIINAFLVLLNNISIFDITNDKIIKEANVAKGTFYNHFRNKEDIIKTLENSIIKETIKSFISQYRELGQPIMSPNLFLEIFAEVSVPIVNYHRNQIRIISESNKSVHELWKKRVEKRYQRIVMKVFPKTDKSDAKLFVRYVALLFQLWVRESIPMMDNNFKRELLYLSHIKIRKLINN